MEFRINNIHFQCQWPAEESGLARREFFSLISVDLPALRAIIGSEIDSRSDIEELDKYLPIIEAI